MCVYDVYVHVTLLVNVDCAHVHDNMLPLCQYNVYVRALFIYDSTRLVARHQQHLPSHHTSLFSAHMVRAYTYIQHTFKHPTLHAMICVTHVYILCICVYMLTMMM